MTDLKWMSTSNWAHNGECVRSSPTCEWSSSASCTRSRILTSALMTQPTNSAHHLAHRGQDSFRSFYLRRIVEGFIHQSLMLLLDWDTNQVDPSKIEVQQLVLL
jgi:hypothetical protein